MQHRIEKWENALAAFLRSRAFSPFVWGENDCCLFAADAVRAMRGDDFGEPFRGRYETALGAKRMLAEHGGPSGIADASLGARVPALMLHRGDLAALMEGDQEVLGIVGLDGQRIHATGADGTVTRALSDALHGWRV